MIPLCAAVSASDSPGSTSRTVKVVTLSSPRVKRIDQLVHVQTVEEGVTEPLRFVVFVVTLVLLTPATRFPVTRIPAITDIVFAPRVILLVPAARFSVADAPTVHHSSVLNANRCQYDICAGRQPHCRIESNCPWCQPSCPRRSIPPNT